MPRETWAGCDPVGVTAPTLPPADAAEPAPPTSRRRVPPVRDALRRLRPVGPAPAWVAGTLGALWAVVIGLAIAMVPMVVLWMASPDSGLTWSQSLRLGGLLWVVAHGVPITIAGTTYSLLPWGLAIVPLLLLVTGGAWAARRARLTTARAIVPLVVAGTVAYAAAVAVASTLTSEALARTDLLAAIAHAGGLAVLGLGWGALRGAGIDLLGVLPPSLAAMVRGGLAAGAAVLGLGALAVTASLVVHIDDAITVAQSLGAGLGGGLGLLLLGVGYVPVAAAWGAAYLTGAGVIVGPQVTVSPFLSLPGPAELPPFPLLAALPQGTSTLAWLLPLTGVLAGVLAGVHIGRRARREPRLVRLALAGGAAAIAGVVLAAAAWIGSGGLGDERLAQLGPMPLTMGVLGAVLVVLGAAPSAVAPSSGTGRRLAVAVDTLGNLEAPATQPRPMPESEETT